MSLAQRVQERFPQHVIGTHRYRGQETVVLRREGLRELAQTLRDEPVFSFDLLMDLTAADYLDFGASLSSSPTLRTPSPLPYYMPAAPSKEVWERLTDSETHRFEVVYHFYSTPKNHRLRLKVPVSEDDPTLASVTALWAVADWFEREVWDMFGIRFIGHPNLKRILLYEQFVGHPLRKDYPIDKRQPLIGPVN